MQGDQIVIAGHVLARQRNNERPAGPLRRAGE